MSYSQTLDNLLVKPEDYFIKTRPEMLEYIPDTAERILEAGCASGLFGAQLKQRSNVEVWGIEYDSESAESARRKLDMVLAGDILPLTDHLPDAYFDCVIFNDVLEHLIDPFAVLLKLKGKLAKDGIIVCSIPNIRFYHTLKKFIVNKQWKYEDAGIMDKTHLRFFTKASIIDMFDSLGYRILKLQGINGIDSWKFSLLNMLSFGYLSDTRYLQFACVATPK
jgi:2-polyprenyl-3-methyl-5-hydroxy-6-metoxy-1,4-benzoquinol methylase